MRELNLDILKEGLPGITSAKGGFFMEAAIVSLVKSGFSSGVTLKVQGDFEEDFKLTWSDRLDDANLATWKEEQFYHSHGAVGNALVLVQALLGCQVFEEGRIGTGIDFWLGMEELAPMMPPYFKKEARLEISGIGRETPLNSINMRIDRKKKQICSFGRHKTARLDCCG